MFKQFWSGMSGLLVGLAIMTTTPPGADALKDELRRPASCGWRFAIVSGRRRVLVDQSRNRFMAGVPVDLGKAIGGQLGVPVEYVAHNNSRADSRCGVRRVTWDITFLPKDRNVERQDGVRAVYEGCGRDYIVKRVQITNFARSISPAIRSRRQQHTTMRGAIAHLKNAKVTGYRTTTKSSVCSRPARCTRSRCHANQLKRPWQRRSRHPRAGRKPSSRR